MHRSIVPLVASLLLLAFGALGVSTASARTFRLTCRDGVLRERIGCDTDRQSNGVCTFTFRAGVDGFSPIRHVVVPVGQKQVMEYGGAPLRNFRNVLRCLRHHAVVITTPVPRSGA